MTDVECDARISHANSVVSVSEFLAAYRKAHCSEPRPLVAGINQREIDALIARKTEFINGSTPLASGSCVESVLGIPEPARVAR